MLSIAFSSISRPAASAALRTFSSSMLDDMPAAQTRSTLIGFSDIEFLYKEKQLRMF
jgi:hypothetical protein